MRPPDEVTVGLDELVAAREDRDARPLVDGHDAAPERGETSRAARARAACRARAPARPPRRPRRRRGCARAARGATSTRSRSPSPLRVLLAHDRVGARRDRRAGEDPHRLARAQARLGRAARGHLEGDAQLDRALRRGAGRVLRAAPRSRPSRSCPPAAGADPRRRAPPGPGPGPRARPRSPGPGPASPPESAAGPPPP